MSQQLSTDSHDIDSPTLDHNGQSGAQAIDDRVMSWKVATNLFVSFRYAWAGIAYAFKTQRNFRIHTVLGTTAIALGLWVGLSPAEIAIVALTVGTVMTMELLNTAIESVVDLTVKQTYHELAKIAKDCAAAAVLVSAMASLLVAGTLLAPPLLTKLLALLSAYQAA